MITEDVIKEIYQKYKRPPKDKQELRLDYFLKKLDSNHNLRHEDDVVVNYNLEEFNPFRRFLVRSLNTILEFDKNIAFVFSNHILFFDKNDDAMSVYIKPDKPKGFWHRLLG